MNKPLKPDKISLDLISVNSVKTMKSSEEGIYEFVTHFCRTSAGSNKLEADCNRLCQSWSVWIHTEMRVVR